MNFGQIGFNWILDWTGYPVQSKNDPVQLHHCHRVPTTKGNPSPQTTFIEVGSNFEETDIWLGNGQNTVTAKDDGAVLRRSPYSRVVG
jgi:hypothetical protein